MREAGVRQTARFDGINQTLLLGIALASASTPLLTRLVPTSLPLAESPSLDIGFMTVAVAITLRCGWACQCRI